MGCGVRSEGWDVVEEGAYGRWEVEKWGRPVGLGWCSLERN